MIVILICAAGALSLAVSALVVLCAARAAGRYDREAEQFFNDLDTGASLNRLMIRKTDYDPSRF